MISPTHRQRNLRRRAELVFLLSGLFAPSLWLLAKIPPLWKDADAYLQVTGAPNSSAFLHYGPLYCFLARIPLFFGYWWDCVRLGLPLPTLHFFAYPILSDTGVGLLLFVQHCALAGAVLFLIASSARSFRVRLLLASLWTVNPLFYTWAHCVGSEALSLVFVLLLATTGFRLVARAGRISPWLWLSFGLLLTLCLLTRYLNGMLVALLPLAFVFSDWPAKIWQRASISAATGLASIVVASATLHAFSYAVGIHCHTSAGFTFLFRLNFLAPLSLEKRNALLETIAHKNPSPEVLTALEILREQPLSSTFEPMKLLAELQARLPPAVAESDQKLTVVLQQTARVFLFPPSWPLLNAAAADFSRAQNESLARMVRHPFLATVYFFGHREVMEHCASLVTFRGETRENILALPGKHPWLRLGKKVTYRWLLLFGLTSLVLCAIFARDRLAVVGPCAAAFILVGLGMVLANGFLTAYQARHLLPMWELTAVAITLLLGNLFQAISRRGLTSLRR